MRIKLAFAAAVFLPILLIVAGHGETAQQPESTLDKRVVELEKRVESLEQLVVQLSEQLNRLQPQAMLPRHPPPNIPPGSREYEFNGMRYYLIPVEKAEGQQH